MSIPLTDTFGFSPNKPNIDKRYLANNGQPYTSVSAAETALASRLVASCVGLTVLVKESGWTEAKEYWVQPLDTTPVTYGFVEKGASVTDYNDLDNKPTISDGGQGSAQIPLSGNVKVTATAAASGQPTGVAVTAENGGITMAFTLEKGADGVTPTIDPTTRHWMIGGVDTGILAQGADAVNPFKGWYKTGDTLPATGNTGDYLYFKNTSETPAVTTIYRWDDTESEYVDTETEVDESNVNTFASNEKLNEVHIVNDLTTGGTGNVLSAEQGKVLVETLSIIPSEEQDINLKPDVVWLDGYNSIDTNGNVVPRESLYRTSEYITLPSNSSTINYKGGTASTSSAKQVAVYNDSDECLGTFFQYPVSDGGNVFDISNLTGATKIRISEYSQRVSGDTWDISVVALVTKTNQEVFDDFSQSVDNRFDEVNEGLDDIDEKLNNADEEYYLSDPVDKGTNLKNDVEWVEGFYYLDANGGLITATSVGRVSDYVSLPTNTKSIIYKGGIDTTVNHKQVAIYDKNDNCLAVFRETPVASEGNVYDITNYPTATKMRISQYRERVENGTWDISVIHSVRQTNQETFGDFVDWIDSLNQWKGKRFIGFGASTSSGGFADGTSYLQIASNKLKMLPPLNGFVTRRVSLKYVDGALNTVGLAATVSECESISQSANISYETQFAKDFDCVLFGGFAGESYEESEVVIDGTTYYGGEELIDFVRLPQTRYNNSPHFTYTNGDTLAQHRDSYIGALIYLLDALWTLKPTCRVVFVYSFLQWNNYSYWDKNKNGIKKLCEKLHLPFVDLAESVYFNGFTTGTGIDEDKTNPNIFLWDGQHPSLAGRQRLGNIFTHKLLLLS